MSKHNDDLKLKLAWQTAFELRTCPDGDTLHTPDPDGKLNKHLAICHVCREKLDMQQDEQGAWKALRNKFVTLSMKPGIGTDRQAGQVWTIKKEFGGWREDGRFVRPPSVLLLEKIAGTSGWRVAQLYGDKRMMGNGDIALDECYGFAEAWNCYSLKDDRFDMCLGGVKPEELKQVITASVVAHEPEPEGSISWFYHSMEIEVGAFVAVPSVAELAEEWESAEEHLMELIPGLKLAVSGARDFVLDIAAGTLDLLRSTFKPAMVLRGSPTKSESQKLSDEQKKLVQEHCPVVPVEVKVVSDTLTVMLKWIREKPVEFPAVSLMLNGVELIDVDMPVTGGDTVVIKYKNKSFVSNNVLSTSKVTIDWKSSQLVISLDMREENMDCPNGCGKMNLIDKKQISGMGQKPAKYNERYHCKQCGRLKEVIVEE